MLLETFSISAAVAKYLFNAAFPKGIAGAYPQVDEKTGGVR